MLFNKTDVAVHITLVTGKDDSGTWSMLVESLREGILDSRCTKTLSGAEWMNEYTENLNEEKKIICCETENKSLYRFGDGEESMSIKIVNVSIAIGSKRMLLELDVVKNNIPLLISKGAISKLGMKIDLTRHKTERNAEVMKLLCISSIH